MTYIYLYVIYVPTRVLFVNRHSSTRLQKGAMADNNEDFNLDDMDLDIDGDLPNRANNQDNGPPPNAQHVANPANAVPGRQMQQREPNMNAGEVGARNQGGNGNGRAEAANGQLNLPQEDRDEIWHEGQLGRGCFIIQGERRRWNQRRFERNHFNAMTRVINMLYEMSNPYRGGRGRRQPTYRRTDGEKKNKE